VVRVHPPAFDSKEVSPDAQSGFFLLQGILWGRRSILAGCYRRFGLPLVVLFETGHGVFDSFGRGMNVLGADDDAAMPSHLLNGDSVGTGFTQASQKRVSHVVGPEWFQLQLLYQSIMLTLDSAIGGMALGVLTGKHPAPTQPPTPLATATLYLSILSFVSLNPPTEIVEEPFLLGKIPAISRISIRSSVTLKACAADKTLYR
jgi:hypothetical protein